MLVSGGAARHLRQFLDDFVGLDSDIVEVCTDLPEDRDDEPLAVLDERREKVFRLDRLVRVARGDLLGGLDRLLRFYREFIEVHLSLSSTTSNDASSTALPFFPFASPSGAPVPVPGGGCGPACCPAPAVVCWYIALDASFHAALRVSIFARMSTMFPLFTAASRASAAASTFPFISAGIFSPNSFICFPVWHTSVSAWFFVSTSSRRF